MNKTLLTVGLIAAGVLFGFWLQPKIKPQPEIHESKTQIDSLQRVINDLRIIEAEKNNDVKHLEARLDQLDGILDDIRHDRPVRSDYDFSTVDEARTAIDSGLALFRANIERRYTRDSLYWSTRRTSIRDSIRGELATGE